MANELALTKETTAQYVHNAAEMESAVFTIDRAIEECERRKKQMLSNMKRADDNDTYRQRARDSNAHLQELRHRYFDLDRRRPSLDNKLACVIGWLLSFICWLLGLIIIIESFVAVFTVVRVESDVGFFIANCCLLIALGTLAYSGRKIGKNIGEEKVGRKLNKIVYERKLAALSPKLDRIKKEIDRIEEEIESQAKRNDAARNEPYFRQIAVIDSQIADLRAKRKQIQSTLSRFYDLGVIPPDYRHMDCAIMLDQIFRNDLADTMREAVMLYEERVFRGEVIRGMDKICSMLNNLTAGMAIIGERISSIDSNVKMMSQDLYNFSERIATGQAEQKKATEQLIRETEMSRYATEQVAESTKNLEWFERRRQGWV